MDGNFKKKSIDEKIEIPFETKYLEDPQEFEDYRKVKKPGVLGRGHRHGLEYWVKKVNGEEMLYLDHTTTDILQKPQTEIIITGTRPKQPIETKTEERLEEIPLPAEIRIESEDLMQGETRIKTIGKRGLKKVIERVSYVGDEITDRQINHEEVIQPAIPNQVYIGIGRPIHKVEEEFTEIPFRTLRQYNPHRLISDGDVVIQQGRVGIQSKQTTAAVFKDQFYEVIDTNEILTQTPIDEIIEYGGSKIVSETRYADIPWDHEHILVDPRLPAGVRQVMTPGEKGMERLTEDVTYIENSISHRKVTSRQLVQSPIPPTIALGNLKDDTSLPNDLHSQTDANMTYPVFDAESLAILASLDLTVKADTQNDNP